MEAAKEDLEIKIANEKMAKPKLTAEFVTMWLKRLRNLDMTKKEHRQRLIDTFINSVYVYDDKLEYTINYKDGTETITFEEASKALAEQESGSDMESSGVLRQKRLEDVRSPQAGTLHRSRRIFLFPMKPAALGFHGDPSCIFSFFPRNPLRWAFTGALGKRSSKSH